MPQQPVHSIVSAEVVQERPEAALSRGWSLTLANDIFPTSFVVVGTAAMVPDQDIPETIGVAQGLRRER
jgi:hypothetical protein